MIENLAESAKKEHIRNEIRDLLNDKIKEAVNIHKKDLTLKWKNLWKKMNSWKAEQENY